MPTATWRQPRSCCARPVSRRRRSGPTAPRASHAEHVAPPQLGGVDVERAGDPVHLTLDGKTHLWRAEAAERAVRHVVRAHDVPADPDVLAGTKDMGRLSDKERHGLVCAAFALLCIVAAWTAFTVPVRPA